jgi:hypothetical protein
VAGRLRGGPPLSPSNKWNVARLISEICSSSIVGSATRATSGFVLPIAADVLIARDGPAAPSIGMVLVRSFLLPTSLCGISGSCTIVDGSIGWPNAMPESITPQVKTTLNCETGRRRERPSDGEDTTGSIDPSQKR